LPEFQRYGPLRIGGSGPKDVYAMAGYTGVRFDGKRWKVLREQGNEMLSTVNVTAIWSGMRNDAIAVGRHDVEDGDAEEDFLHFDGATWHMLPTGFQDEMYAISGRDRAHLYAIGKRVYRFHAKSWTLDDRPGAP
jgi:hypothetical protein